MEPLTEEEVEGAIIGQTHAPGKFYCKKPCEELLEGTREKGPFYQVWQFSDEQLERWLAKGIIEMVD